MMKKTMTKNCTKVEVMCVKVARINDNNMRWNCCSAGGGEHQRTYLISMEITTNWGRKMCSMMRHNKREKHIVGCQKVVGDKGDDAKKCSSNHEEEIEVMLWNFNTLGWRRTKWKIFGGRGNLPKRNLKVRGKTTGFQPLEKKKSNLRGISFFF